MSDWPSDKRRVYELISRHFLACCSERAVGSEKVVRIDIAGEKFTSRGTTVKMRNWLDVYPYSKWNQAGLMPDFNEGDTFSPEVGLRDGSTRPPERLKETDLIALMEQHGIGTDATMAQHIDTTLKRGYATREEGSMQFMPTPLGEALVYAYKGMGLDALWQPLLRAEAEMLVSNIAAGRTTRQEVVRVSVDKSRQQFLKALPQLSVLERSISHFFTRIDGAEGSRNPPISGDVVRRACQHCSQNVILSSRNANTGNSSSSAPLIQCSQYPNCPHRIVFPRATVEAKLSSPPTPCPRCPTESGVMLVDFRFRRTGIPPGFSPELSGECVYCSSALRELFDACGFTGGRQSTANSNQSGRGRGGGGGRRPIPATNRARSEPMHQAFAARGGGATGRGRGGDRAYGNTNSRRAQGNQSNDRCYKCGGVGHWSNNCPQRGGYGRGRP